MTLTVMMARLLVFAPVIAFVTKFAVSPQREYDADASGAQLTRYPPGLISALEKLQDDHDVDSLGVEGDRAPLDRGAPRQGRGSGRPNHLFDTHPPLDDRIRALQAM